ncbi:MAG: WGR domain-containing protein [Cystobacter sp.]
MPLYEFKEGSSSKFWEISLSGNSFTTRWGKIGTKGQEKTQRFSNAVEARSEYDKLVSEKTKKGYVLAQGLAEPAEEQADVSSSLARRNPELEAAIEKAPDDVAAYRAYGEWLTQQGDPRGELIALQCAEHLASGEEAKALKQQASAWVRKYKSFLLGELAGQEKNEVSVEWRFGFIRSARLAKGDYDSEFDVAGALTRLLALPSARFLRELTIGMADFDGDNSYGDVIASLARASCPTLERLFLGDFEYPDETEISWSSLGDISSLYRVLPGLRSLKLRGGGLGLGEVVLPELREFTVETGGLPLEAVQSLAKAKWPKLERLEVWFGSEEYGAGGGVEDLQPLLDGQGVPALKHLGLRNAEFANALCTALPQAKVLTRLESLDLSMGILTDEGASALVEHAAAFKHLKRLDVTESLLSAEGVKQVAKLGEGVAAGKQRDDEDSEYRYVAVGE